MMVGLVPECSCNWRDFARFVGARRKSRVHTRGLAHREIGQHPRFREEAAGKEWDNKVLATSSVCKLVL